MFQRQSDGRSGHSAGTRECPIRVRKTRDALDNGGQKSEQSESHQDFAGVLPAQKLEPAQTRARGVGGEDAAQEARPEPADAGHARAELQLRVPGVHARTRTEADARSGEVEKQRGYDPRGVQLPGGAGGSDERRAEERPDHAADGHSHDHVVDDVIPDAPVHRDGPVPGVGHLTRAGRTRPVRRRHAAPRLPFPSRVSCCLS